MSNVPTKMVSGDSIFISYTLVQKDILACLLSIVHEKSITRVKVAMEHNTNFVVCHSIISLAMKSTVLFDKEMEEIEKLFLLMSGDHHPRSEDIAIAIASDQMCENVCDRLSILKRLRLELLSDSDSSCIAQEKCEVDDSIQLLFSAATAKGFCPHMSLENIIFQSHLPDKECHLDEEEEEESDIDNRVEEDISKIITCDCDSCESLRRTSEIWTLWNPTSSLAKYIKMTVDDMYK